MILNYLNSKNVICELKIDDSPINNMLFANRIVSYADVTFSKQNPYDIEICDKPIRYYDWENFLKEVEYTKIYTKGGQIDYLVFEIKCISEYINVIMFYRFIDMLWKLIGIKILHKLNCLEPEIILNKYLGRNSRNFLKKRNDIMTGSIDWKIEAEKLKDKLISGKKDEFISLMLQVIDSYLYNPTDVYYRGVGLPIYPEEPSIFRINGGKDEVKIFKDMMVRYPNVFKGNSTIETLTHMQHYELKTRLLDVSTNPLVALYMSVNKIYAGDPDQLYSGEVIVYFTDVDSVKYYDSNKVLMNSKLIFLSNEEKTSLYNFIKKLDIMSRLKYKNILDIIWNNEKITSESVSDIMLIDSSLNKHEIIDALTAYYKLLNIIRKDIPSFLNRIDLKELLKAYVVNVGYVNERIAAQSGGFILFGLDKKYLTKRQNKADDIISSRTSVAFPRIIIKDKKKIYDELIALGINDSTMIPDIEHASKFIIDKYR